MNENILENVRLGSLPKTVKLFITMFLVVMTCGYLMAILNINTSTGLLKETYTPGQKVQFQFGGSPYESIINLYRGSDKDPSGYPGMDLATMTTTSHVHFTSMGMMMFCLGLPFLFTVTLPEWLKKFVLVDSFAAVIIAVTSFWFIKYVSGTGALLMMLSGMMLGFCVMFEAAVPLYEMWLVKDSSCPPPAPVKQEVEEKSAEKPAAEAPGKTAAASKVLPGASALADYSD